MPDSADTPTRLLDAATRLFAERGYEAVGVSEVCEAAGITKPSLYHHFGSKRGLLEALIASRGGPLLAAVVSAATYRGDLPKAILPLALAFTRFAQADPQFYRLRLAMSFAPPGSEPGEAAAAFNQALFKAVEAFFKAAAKDHGNMKGRHRAYAGTFIGTVDTYVGFKLAGHGDLDEGTIREALRQFQHGIYS